jgi:hypothetical protein
MGEGDADKRAEMPEDSRKVAGGTRENTRGSIKRPRRQRKYSTGENLT